MLQHHSFGAATCDLTSEWKNPPASHKIRIILLVEEIMHHLGCIKSKKPVNNGIFYISTGQPDFWTINSPTRWSKAKESCLGDGKLIWYWQGWCLMNYRLCQLLRFVTHMIYWVVVSNIFHFYPYLGKISNLTNIFGMGSNHQLVYCLYTYTINNLSAWIILASVSDSLVSFKMKAYYDAGKQVLARRLLRDLPVKVIKWSSTVGGPTIHFPKTFARLHTHPSLVTCCGKRSESDIQTSHPKPSQAIPSHPSTGRSSIQEGKALAAHSAWRCLHPSRLQ